MALSLITTKDVAKKQQGSVEVRTTAKWLFVTCEALLTNIRVGSTSLQPDAPSYCAASSNNRFLLARSGQCCRAGCRCRPWPFAWTFGQSRILVELLFRSFKFRRVVC